MQAKKARLVRGLAIKHLTITEQNTSTSRLIKEDLPTEEEEEIRGFLANIETQHGIGRTGALELLLKASTFYAISEMEREGDQAEGAPD